MASVTGVEHSHQLNRLQTQRGLSDSPNQPPRLGYRDRPGDRADLPGRRHLVGHGGIEQAAIPGPDLNAEHGGHERLPGEPLAESVSGSRWCEHDHCAGHEHDWNVDAA